MLIFIILTIIALYISSGLILMPGILVRSKSSIYITQKASLFLKNIAALLTAIVQMILLI